MAKFKIDPVHEKIDLFEQPISKDIWQEKYRYSEDERSPADSLERVAHGLFGRDNHPEFYDAISYASCLEASRKGLLMLAGRIQAGAGTSKTVTLMNCYVNETLDDSMEGISEGLKRTALTLQQGGGIGTDFTPLRPKGAILKRLGAGAYASGPVSFMLVWDSLCRTIMSAGSRRGAMMGTLMCTHPDVIEFINAKHEPGVLTMFNMSVLVTDAFMEAVKYDELWALYFHIDRADGESEGSFIDNDGVTQYIYQTLPARELWNIIMKSTYEFSEPGVIFIDRINSQNNLQDLEHIQCTNPCGEQPLPPNGACDLGAVNLARMVKNPCQPDAEFDWELLRKTVSIGVEALDRVISVSNYPLEAQRDEMLSKRRIGLGITGLADALIFLGLRYGSTAAANFTEKIMKAIAISAYMTSNQLAITHGTYPLWSELKDHSNGFISKLPKPVQESIEKYGLRNSVLLTIAPTGTTSIYFGYVSSGLEPVFSFQQSRNVLQADGTWSKYTAYDYAYLVYKHVHPERLKDGLPEHMVTMADLTVEDHLRMQAACQKWVDASVSKTINCPKDISFEDLSQAYTDAYYMGLKGCTTYRPSSVRGSILEDTETSKTPAPEFKDDSSTHTSVVVDISEGGGSSLGNVKPRPLQVEGTTYKVKWPSMDSGLYITINNDPETGKPLEIFIHTTSGKNEEWMKAMTRMISAVMRLDIDASFIPKELAQISSAHDAAWVNGRMYPSLVAYIGHVLQDHIDKCIGQIPKTKTEVVQKNSDIDEIFASAEICVKCGAKAYIHEEGCGVCKSCGFSNCG